MRKKFTVWCKRFYNNFIVLNHDKCSFMLLGVDHEGPGVWK